MPTVGAGTVGVSLFVTLEEREARSEVLLATGFETNGHGVCDRGASGGDGSRRSIQGG